ncbi:uncharacterized protein CIMG_11729 [Coccidioides immitis RS]|uniref:Uncharacterized protein n=1 Tax=Coccidioides immitis (strain RS) TaxID=246410 RepID=A0A0D8JUB6_COCIM|nr:uncharacterized protein CIMG_11729 [Coccidioides immitis RS]KJF60551.1 hypothetical protein CIMG_11729 [Coccidioides immitis RS]
MCVWTQKTRLPSAVCAPMIWKDSTPAMLINQIWQISTACFVAQRDSKRCPGDSRPFSPKGHAECFFVSGCCSSEDLPSNWDDGDSARSNHSRRAGRRRTRKTMLKEVASLCM